VSEQGVGRGKPPVHSRFAKGQSGNPKGRPKGKRATLPYDAVLGQTVTVRENGQQRRLPADQAFLLHLANKGLSGDGPASRATLTALEQARGTDRVDQQGPFSITWVPVTPGSVTPALRALRMAQLLDRFRPTAMLKLEPWIVEAALKRLGERQLSPDDQAVIVAATRTPNKVRWPEWWTAA
jgi:hypothetical protein